jgi:hypothetical protein
MIWVQHDLYRNFLKSFNSGDINLSLDIFRSELSDLLTHKPNDFFMLLDKVGIKYKKKQSYEELLDIVLREMKVNEKFVRGLAFIIGENNKVNKKNPKISWVKLLDTIKRGIEQIAVYFEKNPRAEKLFRRKALDMVELKSSVIGDDNRDLKKKDNTVYWIIGISVIGVAGYLVYRHFKKLDEARLRAESLNGSNLPKMELGGDLSVNDSINANNSLVDNNASGLNNNSMINDPSFNVSPDVLQPEVIVPQMPNPNNNIQNQNIPNVNPNAININVNSNPNPIQNSTNNSPSIQQNNVNI